MNPTQPSSATPRPTQTQHTVKTPCSDLVRLNIEADDCPQVLLRVLGLVARDGTIPVTIEAARLEEGIAIAIELDRVLVNRCESMVHRIAGIVAVRAVTLEGRVTG